MIRLPDTTDVLIVGAGPTGIALAATLAQAGIDHVLIDRLPSALDSSRAAVVHAHTLDALDKIGIAEPLAAAGLRIERFTICDRNKRLLRLGFDVLPSRHALLMVTQDVVERMLAERLSALGGQVCRGVTAGFIREEEGRVIAQLDVGGTPHQIEARFVIGADGMHSAIRENAGIGFDGAAYGHSFILADVEMDWAPGRDDVFLFFSSAGLVVVAPLPGGRFRIVAAVEEAPEQPDIADIQAVLDASGPGSGTRVREIFWSSRFRVHHRLANAYRKGRLMLMGDAAHVHSPAGGQGMNTGIVDAILLGELLGDVIAGRRSEDALDLYETLRRPAAASVLRLAGSLTAMAMTKGWFMRALRNFRLQLVGRLPFARRKMVLNLSGLARQNAALLPPITIVAAQQSEAAETQPLAA